MCDIHLLTPSCLLSDLIAFKDWSEQGSGPGLSAYLGRILRMGNTHLYDKIHLLNCACGRHNTDERRQ